jgi:integrase
MASVRKRTWRSGGQEKTAWVVDYFDQQGKRRLKTCRTKKEADEFRTTCSWEIKQGIHTPASTSITVAEAVAMWLEHGEAEELEAGTLRTYGIVANEHVVPIIGKYRLAQLTRPMVEQFRDDLLTGAVPDGRKRSRVMARKALGYLKAAIKEAQRRGKVAQNVASEVQIKANRGEDKRRKEIGVDVPDKAEARAIIEAAPDRWRPLILTAVFCGLRSSELRGLTWDHVDFDQRLIRVRQRADRWGKMGPPKTKAGRRDVPMAPIVLNTLREWKLACPRAELGLVFPTPSGAVMDHAMVYRRCFGDVQIACGVARPKLDQAGTPVIKLDKDGVPVLDPETRQSVIVMVPKYGPHAFRHFCASWLIEQGFGPKRIMGIMGHASITMTFDLYGHLFPAGEEDHERLAAGQVGLVG